MGTPPPLGAISAGIRYQVRFFWRHALAMLHPDPAVAKVVLEHRGVEAVDDVVVFYNPPGVNDRGRLVSADFHQLKFHVARSGAVDHYAVLDPAWTGTKVPILLRLAEAWSEISGEHPGARLKLVTNWPWAPSSPVARLIRDGGGLSADFFTATSRSEIGRIRSAWEGACGLSAPGFRSFVEALRFSTSAVSEEDAELWLIDRCQLAGLVPVQPGVEHSPYDDLGARLIESGRTEHTPESLRALVERAGLVATNDPPFRSTFAVRSFTRFAHVPDTDGACQVDLTDLFEGRYHRSHDSWAGPIRQRLEAALSQVDALPEPVHVALDAHLSIAWYTGHLLDPKFGKQIALRQRVKGKGIEIWDVSAPRRPEGAEDWAVKCDAGKGTDLAIVVSVTHSAEADALRYVRESLPAVGKVVFASLPNPGPQAVQDGPHARWLVDDLMRSLGVVVSDLRPAHVHLFPACPASIAFLLGQEGRLLGPTTIYEYDFGHVERRYRAGMTTNTEPTL